MKNLFLTFLGKTLSYVLKLFNLGNGSTWPGHIALKLNPNFTKGTLKKSSTIIIFIVGTNGKTTTTSLLSHLLQKNGGKVIQNTSGANLLNGLASTILLNTDILGRLRADYLLCEVDENVFPQAATELKPDSVVFLNLFRDQLDRYGEVNTIAKKWKDAITLLPSHVKLVLNADDPQIAYLGKNTKQEALYFGIEDKGSTHLDHASDSTYCPICGSKLSYTKIFYSHLGIWKCPKNDLSYPQDVFKETFSTTLDGLYNKYNVNAAILTAKTYGLTEESIASNLKTFVPAFGRQEKIEINHKTVEIILAKNPSGFNQALTTIIDKKVSHLLLVLNDRIADGTDVSWIWDVDFEKLKTLKELSITVAGERVYDLQLRLKYAELLTRSETDLTEAVKGALLQTDKGETLYILPTYTAMLDVRKILTGKKIL